MLGMMNLMILPPWHSCAVFASTQKSAGFHSSFCMWKTLPIDYHAAVSDQPDFRPPHLSRKSNSIASGSLGILRASVKIWRLVIFQPRCPTPVKVEYISPGSNRAAPASPFWPPSYIDFIGGRRSRESLLTGVVPLTGDHIPHANVRKKENSRKTLYMDRTHFRLLSWQSVAVQFSFLPLLLSPNFSLVHLLP